jgi:hypothetical protein
LADSQQNRKNKILRLCSGRRAANALPWNALWLAIILTLYAEGEQALLKILSKPVHLRDPAVKVERLCARESFGELK